MQALEGLAHSRLLFLGELLRKGDGDGHVKVAVAIGVLDERHALARQAHYMPRHGHARRRHVHFAPVQVLHLRKLVGAQLSTL